MPHQLPARSVFQAYAGNDLRRAREQAGLSMSALARHVNVSVACASRWETGVRRPHSSDLQRIAALLGLSAYEAGRLVGSSPMLSTETVVVTGLRRLREASGLTRNELAFQLGVSLTAVAHWECGRRSMPAKRVARLAAVFDMPPDELLTELARVPRTERPSALSTLRRQAGLTQRDVALLLDVTYGAVSQWERGLSAPGWPQLRRLAVAYKVSVGTVAAAAGRTPPAHLDHRGWRSKDFGSIVRDLRHWQGMTRQELATRVGVGWQTIRRWEDGETRPPAHLQSALEHALGASVALPSPR